MVMETIYVVATRKRSVVITQNVMADVRIANIMTLLVVKLFLVPMQLMII